VELESPHCLDELRHRLGAHWIGPLATSQAITRHRAHHFRRTRLRRHDGVLGREFTARGYEPALAPMYAQMLVGMVALTGQWWLRARTPDREQVAAHLVNLAWNGLSGLETNPAPLPKREPPACDT
jgi:hypothetical protein